MVRKSSALLLGLFTLAYISACKKSKDDNSNGDSTIVHKWIYVNRIEWNSPSGGTVSKDTSGYPASSYADFRSDGKVYSYIPDGSGVYEHDTASYQYNNTVLILTRRTGEKDTMTVESLTSNALTTHLKDSYPGGTEDVWTNLKR